MEITNLRLAQDDEYPRKVDLRKDVYRPLPVIPADSALIDTPEARNQIVVTALRSLERELLSHDVKQLKDCFFAEHAYWRDTLALTYHLRTFTDGDVIAQALIKTEQDRGLDGGFKVVDETTSLVSAGPNLTWIECFLTFKTKFPAATCGGRMLLLPQREPTESQDENAAPNVSWKIWVLTTWLENFTAFPEDTALLRSPGRSLDDVQTFNTDVFIIGGGNAGIILAARLKALGVESIIADRNPNVGDNWALRYDCLQFHIQTSFCQTPYLRTPQLLSRDKLADHIKTYAATFNLNILNSSRIQSTQFDASRKIWTIKLATQRGEVLVNCRHFVQATGIGSARPFLPEIKDRDLFKGVNIHSTQFKNGKQLMKDGIKSILIIGSANTAFDVVEDSHKAGLQTTMVARSPTYIFPWDYSLHPAGVGITEKLPAEASDSMLYTMPHSVAGQLGRKLFASLAAQEPDRYTPLAKAGFPVYDSLDERADLTHNLLERAGGHYNEIGEATSFIISGKVGVKGGTEPIAYTRTGLRFSDGSTSDADAIVWCTGFSDHDLPEIVAEILSSKTGSISNETADNGLSQILDAHDIAARMDATWCVDAEGEVRGMWKRHLRMENYWIVGGHSGHHRYYSRVVALQIKAALEGILPEAYRDTPAPLEKEVTV